MKLATLLPLLTPALAQLDTAIKAKGRLYFGTALDPNTINDTAVNAVAKAEFGAFTPENSAKWESIHPSRTTYNYANFDTLVAFAEANGKKVRGHTLVWHSQLPQWVKDITNATELTTVIQEHIAAVVGRYKGRILHWDVVNEVIDDSTGGLRTSVFSTLLGESFIDIAFNAARAADPAAKLYINDYSVDFQGTKLTAMVNLIARLKSRGVPVDGVGTQAHLILGSTGGFPSSMTTLATTGLDIAITELDIRILKPVDSTKLAQQQTEYQAVTAACISQAKCVGITTWGISDKNSWVDTTFPTYDSPLLWDDNVVKKAAYNGVATALGVVTTTGTTTTGTTTSTSSGCTVAKWGQCGGLSYTGCKTCVSGTTCVYSNDWYSQCL